MTKIFTPGDFVILHDNGLSPTGRPCPYPIVGHVGEVIYDDGVCVKCRWQGNRHKYAVFQWRVRRATIDEINQGFIYGEKHEDTTTR